MMYRDTYSKLYRAIQRTLLYTVELFCFQLFDSRMGTSLSCLIYIPSQQMIQGGTKYKYRVTILLTLSPFIFNI